jgi:hypothetical protein
MVDERIKQKYDAIDLGQMERVRRSYASLGTRSKVFNKLVDVICDIKRPDVNEFTKTTTWNILEYYGLNYRPNIKDLLEATDKILSESLYSEIDDEPSKN